MTVSAGRNRIVTPSGIVGVSAPSDAPSVVRRDGIGSLSPKPSVAELETLILANHRLRLVRSGGEVCVELSVEGGKFSFLTSLSKMIAQLGNEDAITKVTAQQMLDRVSGTC